jgi:hypothetical protein
MRRTGRGGGGGGGGGGRGNVKETYYRDKRDLLQRFVQSNSGGGVQFVSSRRAGTGRERVRERGREREGEREGWC